MKRGKGETPAECVSEGNDIRERVDSRKGKGKGWRENWRRQIQLATLNAGDQPGRHQPRTQTPLDAHSAHRFSGTLGLPPGIRIWMSVVA